MHYRLDSHSGLNYLDFFPSLISSDERSSGGGGGGGDGLTLFSLIAELLSNR